MLLLLCSLWGTSCNKNKLQGTTNTAYNATIVGEGLDCGSSYLIKFDSTVTGLPENISHIYYEINLPDTYKIPGRRIAVAFRSPYPGEYINCTMQGPTYAQVYIISVDGFEQ